MTGFRVYLFLTGILLSTIGFSIGNILSEFHETGVVPDVLDKAPNEKLEVLYGDKNLTFGEELTPTLVKDVPTVKYNHEGSEFYTLIMTDPDVPTRKTPIMAEWIHWLVVNIPGDDVSRGENLVDYTGARPLQGAGFHRYVFLIYKQPGKLHFHEKHLKNHEEATHEKFSTRKFSEKYNLGNPQAGNMFQAKWDNFVPISYHQHRA